MIQNVSSGDNNEINFNIVNDVNSNNNKYEYSYENFIITFDIQNNKLMIEIQNKLTSDKYQKQYSQEELIKINKVFSLFDSVEDSINKFEINKNNFYISIKDNICIFMIKLDTKELPKNKISDRIIFEIPLIELKIEKNNSNISLINRNLKYLKIENNISIESINNASPHNSSKSSNNLKNSENLNNIVQNLVTKIDELIKENKEIKERLNVLEENNNKLINIIKENRINLLKENNKLDNPALTSSNYKLLNENNKNDVEDNIDFVGLSLSIQNDSQNDKSNFLKNIYSNFLKNKTKNKYNIEDELIINKIYNNENIEKEKNDIIKGERKKSNISDKSKNDDDNYFYSNKSDVNLRNDTDFRIVNQYGYDLMNLNNNKINKEEYNFKKNIISLDENEEEKKRMRGNSNSNEEFGWSVNNSYNLVGAACPDETNDRNINQRRKKEDNLDQMYEPNSDFQDENDYLY